MTTLQEQWTRYVGEVVQPIPETVTLTAAEFTAMMRMAFYDGAAVVLFNLPDLAALRAECVTYNESRKT